MPIDDLGRGSILLARVGNQIPWHG
jgi:hypothetical protein